MRAIAIASAALFVATAIWLLTNEARVAGQQDGVLKLEGTWIARAVELRPGDGSVEKTQQHFRID